MKQKTSQLVKINTVKTIRVNYREDSKDLLPPIKEVLITANILSRKKSSLSASLYRVPSLLIAKTMGLKGLEPTKI